MKTTMNLKPMTKISEKKIVIDCFDKILVSYCDGVSSICCNHCIKSRFISTRKDRTNIKRFYDLDLKCDQMFDNLINSLVSLLKKDKRLMDEYNRRKVFIIDKNTFSISWEYVMPVSDCPICGYTLIDGLNIARILGQSILDDVYGDNDDISFSKKGHKDIAKRIQKIALSKNFGIITTLLDDLDGVFKTSAATIPIADGRTEIAMATTSSIKKSRMVALFKAVERHGGLVPVAKKTIIFESFNVLKSQGREVLDVRNLILNQDSLTNSGMRENDAFHFSYDEAYHWIYGYDLINQKTLLLPETVAYCAMTLKSARYRREIMSYEVSDASCAGATLTESAYRGILKVVERDAFLTSWYTNRSICRLVLDNLFMSRRNIFQIEFEKFQNFYSDFKIDIYEISCQTRIPVVLMTLTRKRICLDRMNFICAVASDADIVEAMQKAMHKISGKFVRLQKRFASEYKQVAKKAEHMYLIDNVDDHSLVWGYYKNLSRINFSNQVSKSVNVSWWIQKHRKFKCLNEAFKAVLEDLKRNGRDVICVNQTTSDMQLMNIYCSKILIPGLLPMTFGAKNARISRKRINEIEKTEKGFFRTNFFPHPLN